MIRLRKAPNNGLESNGVSARNSIALTPQERILWKNVDQLISSSDKEIVGQLYVEHVMKPLLGSNYVDAGVCMPASDCCIVSLSDFLSETPN